MTSSPTVLIGRGLEELKNVLLGAYQVGKADFRGTVLAATATATAGRHCQVAHLRALHLAIVAVLATSARPAIARACETARDTLSRKRPRALEDAPTANARGNASKNFPWCVVGASYWAGEGGAERPGAGPSGAVWRGAALTAGP